MTVQTYSDHFLYAEICARVQQEVRLWRDLGVDVTGDVMASWVGGRPRLTRRGQTLTGGRRTGDIRTDCVLAASPTAGRHLTPAANKARGSRQDTSSRCYLLVSSLVASCQSRRNWFWNSPLLLRFLRSTREFVVSQRCVQRSAVAQWSERRSFNIDQSSSRYVAPVRPVEWMSNWPQRVVCTCVQTD